MIVGEANTNPYVGLRPYRLEDHERFFGRREQVSELLETMRDSRFIAVVGSSGCGKSSIIRAGLMPALLGGFLAEYRDLWQFAVMKPGESPLRNLARALVRSGRGKDTEDDSKEEPDELEQIEQLERAIHEQHTRAVEDYLVDKLGERSNALLLIDQFEEIFTFRGPDDDDRDPRDDDPSSSSTQAELIAEQREARLKKARHREEADTFVDILVNLGRREDLPIYTVLTMRTDFLGDCDVFDGLPEAMNRGRYLVPRLSRRQLRHAVAGPARYAGTRIAPRLLDYVLNELGDRSDRLPVLQHALFRTFKLRSRDGGNEFTEEDLIDLEDFRKAGTLDLALSDDADEALELCRDKDAVERVFRCLTDTDASHRRVRRPCSLGMIEGTTGLSRATIKHVLEQFRGDGRQFVYYTHSADKKDRRVDISHESFIRQWVKLKKWVDDERESRDQFLKLVELSRRKVSGQGSLLRNLELKRFQRWKERAKPTQPWARRYTNRPGDLADALRFLARSARAQKWWRILGLGVVLLIVGLIMWIVLSEIKATESERKRADQVLVALAVSKFDEGRPDIAGLLLDRVGNLDDEGIAKPWNSTVTSVLRAGLVCRLELLGGERVSGTFAGRYFATASKDGDNQTWALRKWDLDSKDPAATPVPLAPGPGAQVLAMKAKWPYLVTASADGLARLWDLESGTSEPLGLEARAAPVHDAAFGAKVVLVASDKCVEVFDLEAKLLDELSLGSLISVVSVHPDGDRALVATVDGYACMWKWKVTINGSVGSESKEAELERHDGAVIAASISADGKYVLTASWDGTFRVSGIARPEAPEALVSEKCDRALVAASFHPTNSSILLTASEDKVVRVWKWASGKIEEEASSELTGVPVSAQFQPGTAQTILTATENGAVRFWDPQLKGSRPLLELPRGEEVHFAAFSEDGVYVVTVGSTEVRVWRPRVEIPMSLRTMSLKKKLTSFLKRRRELTVDERKEFAVPK